MATYYAPLWPGSLIAARTCSSEVPCAPGLWQCMRSTSIQVVSTPQRSEPGRERTRRQRRACRRRGAKLPDDGSCVCVIQGVIEVSEKQ